MTSLIDKRPTNATASIGEVEMPRGAPKSVHNPCPVCGLPRGKGPHEFVHGKCLEERSKTEGKAPAGLSGKLAQITVEQHEAGKRRETAKRYLSGKLPKWMFD